MKIEVLVATMNQTDHSLLEKLNIQTDAIVGNQCAVNEVSDFVWDRHRIKWLSFAEKGVGLNRNNALMRATADICVIADDDMRYVDGYAEIIKRAFERCPDADIIVFNLNDKIPGRYEIKDFKRLHLYNSLRYGTARLAFRLSSIRFHGIFFNLCFGGGTEHSHGEDTLFLVEAFKKGLTIYSCPDYIATLLYDRESTCSVPVERLLVEQGDLWKLVSKRWWRLLCLQSAVRHRKQYGIPWIKAYKLMTSRT